MFQRFPLLTVAVITTFTGQVQATVVRNPETDKKSKINWKPCEDANLKTEHQQIFENKMSNVKDSNIKYPL